MKIVQQTPTELTLRLRPVGIWIMGGIFAAAGLLVMVGFGRVTTLTCRRIEPTQGSCELAESGLLGTKVIEHFIRQILDVWVEESTDSDGGTYRVSFKLKSGDRLPLTSYYSSGKADKQQTADRIRTFLNLSR